MDALGKLASAKTVVNNRTIIQETLPTPCIEEIMCLETEEIWMTPILHYLKTGDLPQDKQEAKKIKRHSTYFFIENDQLYKKSFALPSFHCVTPNEVEYVLKEIHEGICGSHQAETTIALKVVQSGYHWPRMKQEALKLV